MPPRGKASGPPRINTTSHTMGRRTCQARIEKGMNLEHAGPVLRMAASPTDGCEHKRNNFGFFLQQKIDTSSNSAKWSKIIGLKTMVGYNWLQLIDHVRYSPPMLEFFIESHKIRRSVNSKYPSHATKFLSCPKHYPLWSLQIGQWFWGPKPSRNHNGFKTFLLLVWKRVRKMINLMLRKPRRNGNNVAQE